MYKVICAPLLCMEKVFVTSHAWCPQEAAKCGRIQLLKEFLRNMTQCHPRAPEAWVVKGLLIMKLAQSPSPWNEVLLSFEHSSTGVDIYGGWMMAGYWNSCKVITEMYQMHAGRDRGLHTGTFAERLLNSVLECHDASGYGWAQWKDQRMHHGL